MAPHYTFACDECNIYFQVSGSMESPPQPDDYDCPECGGEVYRSFQQDMPGMIFVGMDFYINQERARKYNRYGMDKDTANKFYNDSIKYSKERMSQDQGYYKRMYMDPQEALDTGLCKKNHDPEKQKKKQEAHKVTLQRDRKIKGKE